jgi:hypothetical protein
MDLNPHATRNDFDRQMKSRTRARRNIGIRHRWERSLAEEQKVSHARLEATAKPSRHERRLINEVARWLAAEVERRGYVEHAAAVRQAWGRFGVRWPVNCGQDVWIETSRGKFIEEPRPRFHPEVLKAFRQLTGGSVVAEKNDRAWRKRKS